MNHRAQFWHLVRFHFQSSPWYLLPLVLGVACVFSVLSSWSILQHDGVSWGRFRGSDQLFSLFYVFILALQLSWGLQWGKMAAQGHTWASGCLPFLLTRATHRPSLFCAKCSVFFCLCSVLLLPPLALTLLQPDARIQLSASALRSGKLAAYQLNYPASIVQAPDNSRDQIVTLPNARWDWFSLRAAQVLFISLCILWLGLAGKRHPKIWFLALGLFLGTLFLPLLLELMNYKAHFWRFLWDDEALLFWMHRHALSVWTVLPAFAAGVFWHSYRQFLTLSQGKNAL